METRQLRPPHVVVVGAGISGLTVAYRLRNDRAPAAEVTVLEASERLGGKLRTVEVDGLTVEAGADSFVVRKPWAVDLARELGLEEELVVPGASGAYVWARNRLVHFIEPSAFGIPANAGALLRWNGMSGLGRVRAALDLFKPRRKRAGDQALGAMVSRRMGSEAANTLVSPLLAGLHAADPARLSTLATFPELLRWEQAHGSLIQGARSALKAGPASRGPMFTTVWGGLDRLVQSLAESIGLDRIRTDTPVTSVSRSTGGYVVESGAERIDADAVVLATPAFESARLLAPLSGGAAAGLGEIRYASTAVVTLAYPPGTAARLPEGTGFVVPTTAETFITACTWLSRKWPSPEFGDRAVVRCFVGRDGGETALELSDDELIDAVASEVERATPLDAAPTAARVIRWPRAMPQYDVGHVDRVSRIDAALSQVAGVFVVGSAYRGIGIADCVRQANEVAAAAQAHLGKVDAKAEAAT